MIKRGQNKCPKCGGDLRKYDKVKRILKTKNRECKNVYIRRKQCKRCGSIHRELRYDMVAFKQYEKEIIIGVLEGFITNCTYGFEDYPCESTMTRWRSQFIQLL